MKSLTFFTIDIEGIRIAVYASRKGIVSVTLNASKLPSALQDGDIELIEAEDFYDCKKQLREYFAGERTYFAVPLDLSGTAFQITVWNAIKRIGYSKQKTYGELARSLRKPLAARAVGTACGKNPVPLFIPCHRVIGSNGALGGFSAGATKEDGLRMKRFLLDLESKTEFKI